MLRLQRGDARAIIALDCEFMKQMFSSSMIDAPGPLRKSLTYHCLRRNNISWPIVRI